MKISLTVAFAGLLLLGASTLKAQVYPYPYYYQYQEYLPQAYDPYYELHVLHYELYLPQYQYQPYPITPPLYPSCCFVGGIVISRPRALVGPLPQARMPIIRRR